MPSVINPRRLRISAVSQSRRNASTRARILRLGMRDPPVAKVADTRSSSPESSVRADAMPGATVYYPPARIMRRYGLDAATSPKVNNRSKPFPIHSPVAERSSVSVLAASECRPVENIARKSIDAFRVVASVFRNCRPCLTADLPERPPGQCRGIEHQQNGRRFPASDAMPEYAHRLSRERGPAASARFRYTRA